MNKIKFLTAQHSISYDTIREQLNNTEIVKEIIKQQITLQIAKQLHEDFEMEFYTEENPYVGQTVKAEIVAMTSQNWSRIQKFLELNDFKFSEL